MFDPCRHWRHKLSLYVDGALPESQTTALELHIAHCASCRAAFGADRVLRDAMRSHTGLPNRVEARAFDDRVVGALRISIPMRREATWAARLRSSVPFLNQALGGALFSAGVAGLCLFMNLHATSKPSGVHGNSVLSRIVASPPVPLSTLLQTPTPRAAMLWSAPEKGEKEGKRPLKPNAAPRSGRGGSGRVSS